MSKHSVFLIDGTAFCYRAFYAIRNLSAADGRPTNVIYGFATMFQSLVAREQPTHLAVAFDVGKKTFRHQQFEAYKAHRKPTPEALISQIPGVKALLAAYRVAVFENAGFEAEDVLATIARAVAEPGVDVFLVTGDKDALQLVNDRVQVYNPHAEPMIVDAQAVRSRYGIGPDQVVDLLALMGDSIDNIPGVPGVGEKTAVQLLQEFGTIDALYDRLQEVKSEPRRKALASSREQVALCRSLAQIRSDVPIAVTLAKIAVQEPDWRQLRAIFRDLGFKRLLKASDAHMPLEAASESAVAVIDSSFEVSELSRILKDCPVSVWGEACASSADAAWLAFSSSDQTVAVAHVDASLLACAIGRKLKQWLEDPKASKTAHDAKKLIGLLSHSGVRLRGITGDTMIAAYLLNPARSSPTLEDLSEEKLERSLPAIGAKTVQSLDAQPAKEWVGACAQRALAIRQLNTRLQEELRAHDLLTLYNEMELPLVDVLSDMEIAGVALDTVYLARLKSEMDAQLLRLSQEITNLAGVSFNINSPKQLSQVLFERLKLPVIKRTKTGASTDSDVLQQLSHKHPLPKIILSYRELAKLVSTYVEALPKMVDAKDRLHSSFNQAATSTGRLSSSEPNLQNIPIKTELGRSIRRAFIAGSPDGVLIAADYSQIELRLLAHVSADEKLMTAFKEGKDIHRFTASLIYGIPEAEVQPEQRNASKTVNFGVLYGMSAHGLSRELGVPYDQAQAFIDAYFARYPQVRGYLDAQIQKAKNDGFVQTLFGRRRYIPEVKSSDPVMRQLGERMAINAPLQGTAADLIKRAMIALADKLAREGLKSRMVLQVHDELILESPRSEQSVVAAHLKQTMETAMELSVPLVVTVKAGPNWLDMKAIG